MNSKTSHQLTCQEARIHAHVCGDGALYTYELKRSPGSLLRHPRKKIYRTIYVTSYCNEEKTLLASFKQDILSAYNLKTYNKKPNEIAVRAKWVFTRLREMGAGNSHEWFISNQILKSPKSIRVEWLKAFFDDESHVDVKDSRITLNSVNESGLYHVQALLHSLNIKHVSIRGPYFTKDTPFFRLTILRTGIPSYARQIGFTHPQKKDQLETLYSRLLDRSIAQAPFPF